MVYLGKKHNVRLTPASAWDSTTAHKQGPGAGKRWILLYGAVNRNANATLSVRIVDSSGDDICYISNHAATTGWSTFPNTYYDHKNLRTGGGLIIVDGDAGEELQWNFGAAQGAAAVIAFSVIELVTK